MAKVSDNAMCTFNDWKIHNTGKYLIFGLDRTGEIVVEKIGSKEATWIEFTSNELQIDKPCWVTFHFEFTTNAGAKRSKTILIQWIPSRSSPKDKMQYAMWSNTLKSALTGIHCKLQASSTADLEFQDVIDRVSKFERD